MARKQRNPIPSVLSLPKSQIKEIEAALGVQHDLEPGEAERGVTGPEARAVRLLHQHFGLGHKFFSLSPALFANVLDGTIHRFSGGVKDKVRRGPKTALREKEEEFVRELRKIVREDPELSGLKDTFS